MASEKVIVDSAKHSLEIRLRRRNGKPAVGTPEIRDNEGNVTTPASKDYKPATLGLQAELEAAERAVARATERLQTATVNLTKNEDDIKKFTRVLAAYGALTDGETESTDGADTVSDEAPGDTNDIDSQDEAPAGISESVVEDEAPAESKPRRGRGSRSAVSE